MKKMIMGFAACALAMTSCSNNEVVESFVNNKSQLSFSVASGKQTTSRASEATNTSLKATANTAESGIPVYGYKSDTNTLSLNSWFVDKVWHESNDDTWKMENTHFALESTMIFLTHYPTNIEDFSPTFTVEGSGEDLIITKSPSFSYTIKDVDKQEDLLAGINIQEANTGGDVTLTLGHILSQINFGVKGYKGITIEITDIKVFDVFEKATFTYDLLNYTTTGNWSNYDTNVTSYDYAGKYLSVPATAEIGDTYIFGDGGKFGPGQKTDEKDILYPVGADDEWVKGSEIESNLASYTPMANSLMLMPQEFARLNSEGKSNGYVTFKVKAHYKTVDAENKETTNYILGSESEAKEEKFYLADCVDYTDSWEINLRYVYIIDYTAFFDGRKLKFDIDVDTTPWENYNGTDGIVPVEKGDTTTGGV